MARGGLEPPTSQFSVERSVQLSLPGRARLWRAQCTANCVASTAFETATPSPCTLLVGNKAPCYHVLQCMHMLTGALPLSYDAETGQAGRVISWESFASVPRLLRRSCRSCQYRRRGCVRTGRGHQSNLVLRIPDTSRSCSRHGCYSASWAPSSLPSSTICRS